MTANSISLAEFRNLMERGHPPTILDVRTPAEYSRLHASGAQLMPLDTLDPVAIAARHRASDDAIYVICQSGTRATKACQRLQDAGVAHAYCIEGGTAAWEQVGLPVVRGGGKVISLERQVRIGAGALVLLGVSVA
jgi:rhodanese-related sulfurtransferase